MWLSRNTYFVCTYPYIISNNPSSSTYVHTQHSKVMLALARGQCLMYSGKIGPMTTKKAQKNEHKYMYMAGSMKNIYLVLMNITQNILFIIRIGMNKKTMLHMDSDHERAIKVKCMNVHHLNYIITVRTSRLTRSQKLFLK